MLSVICPIYNEEKYIRKCIDSILSQDYPYNDMEVLFVDGMSTDRTRNIVSEYTKQYSHIRLIDNPHKIVPCAMNIGIRASKGDVIIRLDAHASYQPDYFSVLYRYSCELCVENVGVVCRTDVLNKTPKTLAIREVLSNKFGVGNSAFRTGINQIMAVDTVPFGCWPRSVFDRYGLYDERLIRNQDIELNKRIKHGGGKIVIVTDTYCTYLARETFSGLAKNNFGNGKWNILTVYYTGQLQSLSLRHFIPLIFLVLLILPIFVSFIWLPLGWVSILSIIGYLFAIGIISGMLAHRKGLHFGYLLWSFIVLHLSYGWGSLCGLGLVIFNKKIGI